MKPKLIYILIITAVILSAGKCKDKKQAGDENVNVIENTYAEGVDESYKKVSIDDETSEVAYPTIDMLFASLERTPCFGRCPVYRLFMYNNGIVVYHVRMFVEGWEPGFYKGVIELDKLNEIEVKANETNYFSLNNEYPDPTVLVADLPVTKTYLNVGDRKKRITNRNYDFPHELRQFESFIDSVAAVIKWEKVE